MPINFVVNDPMAGNPPTRSNVTPAADRPADQVRFVASGLPPEAEYNPGTRDFAAWQCREAAWRTLDVFESVCGRLRGWRGSAAAKTLRLVHNGGVELNAFYDRRSIAFFEAPVAGRLVYSGASSDVVAHETGHAILDALRPDLWDVSMMEVAAFHEGFGDCIAIMFALSDRPTRQALLSGGVALMRANFVEATAEELSDAIRIDQGPNHNAAGARRAHNNFVWALPQTLPIDGPPGTLINEAHSLGQLLSGIYYDLIAGIFSSIGTTEAALWTACQRATQLLVSATVRAQVRPRFFESWGRMLSVVDASDHNGANTAAIEAALQRHGITVRGAPNLTPQAAVSTSRRRGGRRGVVAVSPQLKQKLRDLMNLDQATRLVVRRLEVAGESVAEVAADVRVDLSGLSERLAGVGTRVPRPTLLGEVNGAVAVLGQTQSSMVYTSEVRDFVATLVRRDAISVDGPRSAVGIVREREKSAKAGKAKPRKRSSGFVAEPGIVTHVVTQHDGERLLERVAFACGCARHRSPVR